MVPLGEISPTTRGRHNHLRQQRGFRFPCRRGAPLGLKAVSDRLRMSWRDKFGQKWGNRAHDLFLPRGFRYPCMGLLNAQACNAKD